jgi:hypothetical protein
LGDNTITSRGYAVKVKNPAGTGDLSGIVRIAAGGTGLAGHSLAIAADGTAYAWGYNGNGQLGIGTASSTPVKLPIAVGANLSLLPKPPEVTITANVTQEQSPGYATITAFPTDLDDNLSLVEFYCQGQLRGSAFSAPWQLPMSNLPAGSYTIYAKAIDATGLYAVSMPVTIVISPDLSGTDQDADGLLDAWEMLYFGSLDVADPASITQPDGLTNKEKANLDLNPNLDYSSPSAAQSSVFFYDPAGRLTGAAGSSAPATYTPDEEGNLLNAQ